MRESAGKFREKERAIGVYLVAGYAALVHRRPEDHTREGWKMPDAIVRYGPDDPGRITEFKTLTKTTTTAVKNDIIRAGGQLAPYGGGDVVIDGRNVGLTEDVARRGYVRAAGQARQHGQPMPQRARIILGDSRTIDLGEEAT
ncbi:MAG: hypothetical protein GEU94_05140 [Micromonosporaceae bacterium]|nr:hypothetical protein [Micromonosporaceae bacterium]